VKHGEKKLKKSGKSPDEHEGATREGDCGDRPAGVERRKETAKRPLCTGKGRNKIGKREETGRPSSSGSSCVALQPLKTKAWRSKDARDRKKEETALVLKNDSRIGADNADGNLRG